MHKREIYMEDLNEYIKYIKSFNNPHFANLFIIKGKNKPYITYDLLS